MNNLGLPLELPNHNYEWTTTDIGASQIRYATFNHSWLIQVDFCKSFYKAFVARKPSCISFFPQKHNNKNNSNNVLDKKIGHNKKHQ